MDGSPVPEPVRPHFAATRGCSLLLDSALGALFPHVTTRPDCRASSPAGKSPPWPGAGGGRLHVQPADDQMDPWSSGPPEPLETADPTQDCRDSTADLRPVRRLPGRALPLGPSRRGTESPRSETGEMNKRDLIFPRGWSRGWSARNQISGFVSNKITSALSGVKLELSVVVRRPRPFT